MFENLSDKLQRVFKNLRGEGKLTAENMEAALKEIRVALLEADVHFKVVKTFIENVRQKAMGEEVLASFSPGPAGDQDRQGRDDPHAGDPSRRGCGLRTSRRPW